MKKLFQNIKSSFSRLDKILSISIDISGNYWIVNGGLFVIKDDEIKFEEHFQKLDKDIISKTPIVLTFEGKGILNKFVETPQEKIKIRNVIPNIKEEDFYINTIPSGNASWVNLIRKDKVSLFTEKHSIPSENIIDLQIGYAHVQYLSEVFKPLPQRLGNKELLFENKKLIGISELIDSIQKVSINSFLPHDITKEAELAYLSALINFTKLNQSDQNEQWGTNYKNQIDKKKFFLVGKITLGLLLIVFVGNMIANQLLNNSLQDVNSQAAQYSSLTSQLTNLKKEIEVKEAFIQNLGLGLNPHFAHLADEIGLSVPKKIQLKKLSINPTFKSIRKNKIIDFKNGVISITGLCNSTQVCNKWVQKLRKLNWAKEIELVEYKINTDLIGEFLIEISI